MDTPIIIGIICCILLLSSSIIIGIFYLKPKAPPITQPPALVTQQPITQPPVTQPPVTKKSDNLINFARDTTKYMAWDNMMYKTNQDTTNLGYIISCNKPWDAYYKLGCTLPSESGMDKPGSTQYTNAFGPVSKNNWQGPDIRIAPDGQQNFCAQLGGTLSVLRQRPGDKEMLDITDQLQNSTTTDVYNGSDPVFVDNYNTDC